MSDVVDEPIPLRPARSHDEAREAAEDSVDELDDELSEPHSDDAPTAAHDSPHPAHDPADEPPLFDPNASSDARRLTHTVCLLGSTAAGKTCFLAGLAVLGEPNRAASLQVHAAAATKRRLNELGDTLARGEWPAATNQTELLKLAVLRRGRIVDLVVVDYPGGDFERGVGALDSDLAPVLDAHFREADALLLLFDPQLDVLPLDDADPALQEQRRRRQDAFLQAVRERAIEQIRAGRPTPDVACVLTKADRWPELTDSRSAKRFVEKHAPHLLEKLRTLGFRVAFFPVSAVGETEYDLLDGEEFAVPLTPVEPRGYEELFDWVVARRRARQPWPRWVSNLLHALVALVVIASALLLVPFTHDYRETQRAEAALHNVNASDADRIRNSRPDVWLFPPTGDLVAERSRFIEERLDDLAGRIQAAHGDSDLREAVTRLDDMKKADVGSHRGRLDELKGVAAGRIEQNLFDRVAEAYKLRAATFSDLAHDYLDAYASGPHAGEVRNMLDADRAARRQAARQRIKNLPTETAFQLQTKADAIDAYVKSWPPELDADRKSLARAAELSRQFAAPREYTVRLKKTGKFNAPHKHMLTFWVNEHEAHKTTSQQAATEVNWWGETFRLRWKVGDPVDLSLGVDGFTDVPVGRLRGADLFGLWACHGRKSLQLYGQGGSYSSDAYVELNVDGLTDADWRIVAEYLSPGSRW